jgi:serine/threonine-protein kinase
MLINGSILNDTYHIIEEIGAGGGGVVYKAYHDRLKINVVVKKIKENVKDILDSRAEADILKNIKHTYLPRVYDFLEIDGEIFTVMDYIPGRSLAQELNDHKKFSQKQVLKWAGQLAEALDYLHRQTPPVIHSDIKPANIMLTPEGNICLIDFNISLAFDNGMKTSTGISGGYSPPEQYRDINNYHCFTQLPKNVDTELMTEALGCETTELLTDETEIMDTLYSDTESIAERIIGRGVDERSDIYSLGATLYHLLTGVKPQYRFESIKPISKCDITVSEGFAHIIEKMMELLPDQRYQNGTELLYSLNHIYELDSGYKAFQRKQKTKKLAVVLVYVLSFIMIGGGVFLINKEKNAAYNRDVDSAGDYIEAGNFDMAGSAIDQAIELIPNRIDAYSKQATLFYTMGNYDECIAYCRDVINNPSYNMNDENDEHLLGNVYFILGNAYFEKDDQANAIICFEKAIELNQTNNQYFRDYAISLAKTGVIDKAESVLKTAIDLGLGQDSIYIVQGEIEFSKGNYTDAEQYFSSAISTAETDSLKQRAVLFCAKSYQNLGNSYLDKEIALLENAENSLGTSANFHIVERLGDAYTRKARLSASAKYYDQAIKKFEYLYDNGYTTYQIMENIAILYQQVNNFSSAEKMLTSMAEKYPDQYKVYKRLAFLEADKQQRRSNSDRDYHKMKIYYDKAFELYESAEAKGVSDTEMQMLQNMMNDIKSGGWL